MKRKKRETDFSQSYLVQQEAQIETHEIPFKCKKVGPTLATGCPERFGVPLLGHIQNLTSHGPGQPVVVILALRRGLGLDDLQSFLTNSAIL